MYVSLIFCSILLSVFQESVSFGIRPDDILLNREKNVTENFNHIRRKRYLGLSRRYKLNKRYQECVSLGDAKGHCKHLVYCPISVLKNAKNVLDFLCVIERMHVGVCCPDDIAQSGSAGSQIILDLPGGGNDYDESAENTTGCGMVMQHSDQKTNHQFPWMAALYNPEKFMKGIEQQFCGGSLITEFHVLTAAHCTQDRNMEEIRVRLGEYNFGDLKETRSRDYAIQSIKDHEDFDKATYANDISIIKLQRPTSFNTYIWPICLPPLDLDYEEKTAIVAGWGQQYYGGPVSQILLNVEVPIWTLEKCSNSVLQTITQDNLCAAGYEGGKDSCLGDSGGPLMYQLENGRWVAIGIVSWGINCGNAATPGIYTKVANYIPWILKNTISQQ